MGTSKIKFVFVQGSKMFVDNLRCSKRNNQLIHLYGDNILYQQLICARLNELDFVTQKYVCARFWLIFMHFLTILTHISPQTNIFIAQKYVYMLGKNMIEENKVTSRSN